MGVYLILLSNNLENIFFCILSDSSSPHEFSEIMVNLAQHAQDVHDNCKFHSKFVCSCGCCADKNNQTCPGKCYEVKMKLTCPFHFLAYQIECEYRASQANDLVHPDLKKGHSNWVEASHNVLIRFRPKHIHLERLQYALSTDLGFLQANMTFNYDFLGAKYHWLKDLFDQLGLPAY